MTVSGVELTQIVDQKFDLVFDKAVAHIQNNPNLTQPEKDLVVTDMRNQQPQVKNELHEQYQKVPGQAEIMPMVNLGFRIRLGKKR